MSIDMLFYHLLPFLYFFNIAKWVGKTNILDFTKRI